LCNIFLKNVNNENIEKLQKDLDRLGEWAAENEMKVKPSKYKAVLFTRARVKDPLNYTLGDQLIPEKRICKYLGTILRGYLNWADHVNYTAKKAWKALHFITHILKKGNSSSKSLAYTTLVRPILEYGAACWDPYREGQIHALDMLQKKGAKCAHHTNESSWETLSQRRKISRIYALFKPYSGERTWKAIADRLQRPNYLSRVDHERKIRKRKQTTDIGKYSFVNRTIRLSNRLPAEILGTLPCKPNVSRKRVRKVINAVN